MNNTHFWLKIVERIPDLEVKRFLRKMRSDDFCAGETFSMHGFRFLVLHDMRGGSILLRKNYMQFVEDNSDGSLTVDCSECGQEFNDEKHSFRTDTNDCSCPNCGIILHYPEGVDW